MDSNSVFSRRIPISSKPANTFVPDVQSLPYDDSDESRITAQPAEIRAADERVLQLLREGAL